MDHCSLSRARHRIDLDTHRMMFEWVLKRLAEHELLSGKTVGVDSSTIEVRGHVSEPDRGLRRWTAKDPEKQAAKRAEQEAVYRNRRRAKGERSKQLHRKRGELVERAFEHVLDDGGMRRVHLRGRENVHKRYLIHVAAFNLGLILRKMTGFGTP
ncbi:MAG: transposase, partial [Planctomycetota bacterium]